MEKEVNIQTPIRDTIPAGETEVVEMGQHSVRRQISIKDTAVLKVLDQGNLIILEG